MKWAAVLLVALLLAGCGGDADVVEGGGTPTPKDTSTAKAKPPTSDDVLPPGGVLPRLTGMGLTRASRGAGCDLRSYRGTSREHVSDPDAQVEYSSAPPTSGSHLEVPAQDAAYLTAPDEKALVHSLEHGRVVIWFKADLPRAARASLRTFYEDDPFQTLLTPDETGSPYAVAATAWNRDPVPNGTGRLLGCKNYTPEVLEALQAFKKRHRSRGPEAIP